MDYIVVLLLFVVLFGFLIVQSQAITGGATADWGKYPYIARIAMDRRDTKSSGLCTGCAVAEHTILTAAHCMVGLDPSKLEIKLGDGQFLTAEEIVIHPAFPPERGGKRPSEDVALIRVKESIRHTVPLQFEPLLQTDVSETIIAGFGIDDRGRAGTFKTGRATLYDRGFWYTSRGYKGSTVCDEFEANRGMLEPTVSACKRCNTLPHCSCDANGRCMKDGSPEMVASILPGDSGGSVFYLQNGVIHSVIAVNSSFLPFRELGGSFNEAIFAKTSYNEAFLRSTIARFEGGAAPDIEAEPIRRPPRPLPFFFGPTLVLVGFGAFVVYTLARRGQAAYSIYQESRQTDYSSSPPESSA